MYNTIASVAESVAGKLNDIIVRPRLFFSNMKLEGGYKEPLIFSYIIFFAVTAIGFILYQLGLPQMIVLVDLKKETSGNDLFLLFFVRTIAWGAGSFLMAFLYHIGFKIVGGVGNYEATYRIVTYVSAAYIFNIIPRIGIFIYCFYSLLLVVIGGAIVHKISNGKAVIGPLIPIIIITLLSALLQTFK